MGSAARKAWNEAMKATVGVESLPPSLQGYEKRRSHRQKSKSDRRTKARKVWLHDNDEFSTWAWIDALEGVDPSMQNGDDDEEFDELSDLQEEKKKKNIRSRVTKQKSTGIPKRMMPKSLGLILTEEASREDGCAHEFVAAEAVVIPGKRQMPRRKICPVAGVLARYNDPKTRIPYSSLRALAQIQERPPPWMTLGGSITYWETVKSLQDK